MSGLAASTAQLAAGQLTVKQLVRSLATSDELRSLRVGSQGAGDVVALLYDALLARCPDDAGLAFWSGTLAAGTDYTAVVDATLGSGEYAASCGDGRVPGDGRPGCL